MARANLIAVALVAGLATSSSLASKARAVEPLALSVQFSWSETRSLETVTDLGFTVRLDRAEVTSAGFALVPCADQKSARRVSPGDPAILRIGHFSGALPNQLPLERLESLTARRPFVIEGFDPPDIEYCEAHLVMGAARGGLTLTIEGGYRAPGDETWRAFSAATPEAYGAFVPLLSPNGETFRGRLGPIRSVSVVRPAARWFDGLDLRAVSGVAIGHAVLRRIANDTKVTLGP